MPRDAKQPFLDECRLYGAKVTLVDGLITDAGRLAAEQAKLARLVRRLDPQGAVPRRGQEDDGLRAGRAARLDAARLDHLSDRRRHRHGRHVEGVRGDGGARLDRTGKRPQMVTVQPDGCAPIVRAFERRRRTSHAVGGRPTPRPHGLRVPKAIGDFLVLRAIRESGGTALAVTDQQMVEDMILIGRLEGISAAPEGAAALSAARVLLASGRIQPHETRGPLQHRRRAQVPRGAAHRALTGRPGSVGRARQRRIALRVLLHQHAVARRGVPSRVDDVVRKPVARQHDHVIARSRPPGAAPRSSGPPDRTSIPPRPGSRAAAPRRGWSRGLRASAALPRRVASRALPTGWRSA